MTSGVVESTTLKLEFQDEASRRILAIQKTYAKFVGEVESSKNELNQAAKATLKFGDALKIAGGAMAGLFTAQAISSAFKWIDSVREGTVEVANLADRLNESTEFVSKFGYAAGESGIELDNAGDALTDLTERAKEMPELFRKWEINTRGANGAFASTEVLVGRLADRIERASSQSERLLIADEAMADAGLRLVPVLERGSKGLKEMYDQAERVGAVIKDDAAAQIKAMDSQIKALDTSMKFLARTLLAGAAPALKVIIEELQKTAKKSGDVAASMDLPEKFVKTLEFLGGNVIPTVILTGGVLSKIFYGVATAAGFVATGVVKISQGVVELGIIASKVNSSLEIFSEERKKRAEAYTAQLENTSKSLGALADKQAEGALKAKKAFETVSEEARASASAVILATADLAAKARKEIEKPAKTQEGNKGEKSFDPFQERRTYLAEYFDEQQRRLDLEMQSIESADARWSQSFDARKGKVEELTDAYWQLYGIESQDGSQFEKSLMARMRILEADDRIAKQQEQINALYEARVQLVTSYAEASAYALGQVLTGQAKVKDAIIGLADSLRNMALQFIAQEAAKAAAAAFTSQASIPVIGPILGAAAAAAAFSLVGAFAGKFHQGGLVTPQGRSPLPRDLTAPLQSDERFARVKVGETILPAGASEGGGTNVYLNLSMPANMGRARFQRYIDDEILPAIETSTRGGMMGRRSVLNRMQRS